MWLFGRKAKYEKKEEKPDPVPVSETLHFAKPLTLEQRVQRAIQAAMEQKAPRKVVDPADFEFDDPPEFVSPHELVVDGETGMEILPAEKAYLDKQRKEFNDYVTKERSKKKSERTVGKPTAAKADSKEATSGDMHSTST